MLGFALAPDGSKVYVGGVMDGVNVASTADFVFAKKSTTPVQCLAASGTTLFACSDDRTGGFAVGVSTDDGATFAPMLHLRDIRGPLACGAGTATAQCAQYWPGIRDSLDGGANAAGDAAMPIVDAETPDSSAPPSDDHVADGAATASSCAAGSSTERSALPFFAFLALVAWRTRVRTNRTRTRAASGAKSA
jgi:hypothetical protein